MSKIEACEVCGVPRMVSEGHRWEASGVISLVMSPRSRMVFYESENIDDLFEGVERLVGIPIEHIIIESRRRETRRYMEKIYEDGLRNASEETRKGVREGELGDSPEQRRILEMARELNLSINNIGRIYGYGDISLGQRWDKGEAYPWRSQAIRNPYSLPLYAADMLGSVEAVEQRDLWVEWQEIGEKTYLITASPGSHPIELEERLRRQKYDFKPGDIQYERCPECGLPDEVSRCNWDLEGGTIIDPENGRRMSLFGPGSLDAILGDLEAELGEDLPEAVIAAQRRYITESMRDFDWKLDAPSFRRMIAARGLGNLASFNGDRNTLSVRIENACLHLLMVGTTQAMVEMVYGSEDSTYEWNLAPDGDLDITIKVLRG
ncbi:MAG: hypothetical protein AB1384_08365 [Actinomycetota bacterium]